MSAASKTKWIRTPRARITRAVGQLLPKGRAFTLQVEKSALGGMKVVRVVTPAWKELRLAERIARVREAVEPVLSSAELDNILRFSVLTPKEFKTIFGKPHDGDVAKAIASPGVAKRMARKSASRRRKSTADKGSRAS